MSTHLHLHHQLPNLRIAAVNSDDEEDTFSSSDQTPTYHSTMSSSEITIVETEIKENDDVTVTAVPAIADSETDESYKTPTSKESKIPEILTCPDESYKTPTSKESKIPEILTCPPAPKKPKPFVSCKRKLLDEFQFFEVSNEDMDAFFRSTFPKRTCPCK